MEGAANYQTHLQAIFEEVRKHDSNLSHLQALYHKVGIHPTTHVSSEHRVVGLVRGILLQFQTEVKSTTVEKNKKSKMARMHLQMEKTKAEIEWHEK